MYPGVPPRRRGFAVAALVVTLVGYALGAAMLALLAALRPLSHRGALGYGAALVVAGLLDGILQLLGLIFAIVGMSRARRDGAPTGTAVLGLVLAVLGACGAVGLVLFGLAVGAFAGIDAVH